MRPSASALIQQEHWKAKLWDIFVAIKTNMNEKASGVYDHMPTALYVHSDTF